MSGLKEIFVGGHTLVRIDVYASQNGLKMKTVLAQIATRQLVMVGYYGDKYIDTSASGNITSSLPKKHQPISKVTTWTLNG